MVAKTFNKVFKKFELSDYVKDGMKKTFVTDLSISSKDRILYINVNSGRVLDDRILESLGKELNDGIPQVSSVEVRPFYGGLKEKDMDYICEAYRNNILSYIADLSPVCHAFVSDSDWSVAENEIKIPVKNPGSYYLKKKKADMFLTDKLRNETGLDIRVTFEKSEEEPISMEEYNKIVELREKEALEEISRENAASASRSKEMPAFENGIVFGKAVTGDISKISEAKKIDGTCCIAGKILKIENKEMKKGDKYIVVMNVTDLTDSITVKFFVSKDKFDGKIAQVLTKNKWIKVSGQIKFDAYSNELNLMAKDINLTEAPPARKDESAVKRVELHLHTNMSRMDGVNPMKDYIKRAQEWGHTAIAVTDHGVVQAFPEALKNGPSSGIKILYGVEAYLVDDFGSVVSCPKSQSLDDTYVVFDLETTGLSKETDEITEIGAVKIVNGKITDRFSSFVNPKKPLTPEVTKLTGITDEMLKDAPEIREILPKFLEFCGKDSVLVAHNASFDTGFIRTKAEISGLDSVNNTILDTLELSRCLLPDLKHHKLNHVCKALNVSLEGHHRAVNDAEATAGILLKFFDMLKEKGITNIDGINAFAGNTVNYKKLRPYHAVILVKNKTGFNNLYRLISESHVNYFFKKRPRLLKSLLTKYREGLIVGSACEAGELYRALLDKMPEEHIDNIVSFYDYLEIQPVGNNYFMIKSNKPQYSSVNSVEDIQNFNRMVVELGEKHNKLVVATGDVHFLDPDDAIFRKVIMLAEGFPDYDDQPPLFYRTTEEMLDEFSYLGEEKAYEIVVENTNKIADLIENDKPIPDEKFPPEIEGAEEELTNSSWETAKSIYGDPLPEIVEKRLKVELDSIISNGYAALYVIARRLVLQSVADGYLVGSRGSVGSSFVATMSGITEVNPLPPHYVCPKCKYSDFDSEIVRQYAMEESSGCDMPDRLCPNCGTELRKEGHDIPFETFLGFKGDKEPDIDLNFSGEYQQQAHKNTEVLFGGKKFVYKAGTIGTLADKTAYGFVKKFEEDKDLSLCNAEIERISSGITGVKRTTGQHPGGLIIVPKGHEIYEVCPVQHPADDPDTDIITTHFDYHSIEGKLLKLDLLGHDDPTVIRMLHDITGIDPRTVRLDDKKTMSIFQSTEALGVTPEQIGCKTGTLGIPEFGTNFVRQMLLDTKPETFSDLIRISGLSHGTDVWINNAQILISNGTIKLQESISTRDGIMIYLINQGVEKQTAFKIMEKIRKKDSNPSEEDIAVMRENGVPEWYIDSCQKISYMFPKAHAVAYVMMAFRIAYFKVNYPKAYYAAYFTVKASDDFDYLTMCRGVDVAREEIARIKEKGLDKTAKDKNKITVLEIAIEFYERGFTFDPIDIYKSHSYKFSVTENGLLPPLNSIQGMGVAAAESVVSAREDGEFKTIEDFNNRTSVSKTLIDIMKEYGILTMPDTNQLSLF